MKPAFFFLLIQLCLVSCSSTKKTAAKSYSSSGNAKSVSAKYEMLDENTFKLSEVSDDETYGYSEKNAIKVGGGDALGGPTNERRYLNALLGPEGQSISYARRGSCCAVKSDYGFMGYAMLDIYEIKYEGLEKPVILYLNMYDPGELKAPKGFTFRTE